MDTIFVKNVKENSPAHAAGLSTGDRIISVNGETIGGKSYAEVVQLIQQSTKFLHLLVVPKEDDILQLYFADTAHNPETNQRPSAPSSMRSPEAMLRSSVHRHQHQQQHQQQFSHLPKPRPYRPSAGEAAAQAPTSPRCLSGSGAVVSAPSSLPDAAVYQQNQSQQPHSWHLVARAQPVVTRRSSDANLRIKEVDNYCDPYQVEEHEEHRRRISGSSGWSSDSAGVRSSIPGASFSPRPLHSPPSFCSVDGSEGTLTHDSNGSLHSLPTSYGSPFCSLDPRRRDSTVSLPPTMRCDGFRDAGPPPAASPGGSGACYPEDDEESAVTDSVMRRIRKSFEQKEEFLRRPTQPIWLPQPTAAIPREFYAHPQKFQRPPWPPHQLNGGDVDESPSSPSKQTGGTSSPVSATRKGTAEVADAGSQHGRSRHPGKPFVTTLTRITENLPAAGGVPGAASATPPQSPPPALQLVSRRARQFESGEVVEEGETVVDKTNFYRSELSRLSSKRSVPNVAVRKREFETRGKESRSFDGPGLQHSGAANSSGGGGGGSTGESPCPPSPAPRTPSPKPSLNVAFCGNRLTPVGGGWLHCEPPPDLFEQQTPTSEELESTTTGAQPYGNRSPALQTAPTRSSPAVIRRQKTASQIEDEGERVVRRVSYLKATWGDRMHVDSDLELSDGEQASSGLLRPQDLDQSSRSSTTSDAVMISGIPQPSSATSASARQPHGILRLRSLFTDKQHHHQDATANANAAANLHSGSNKENQQVVKEGWLQCKFTVAEGKRSADRSWKQVKAVLRGSYLHLIKDRKEALAAPQQTPGMTLGHSPASQTGSAATLNSSTGTAGTTTSSSSCSSSSEEVVDVRNGVVDVAEDYTKRKHVFRLSAGPGGPGSHSSEVLLQAEDSIDMLQWIRALQESGCQPEGHAQIVANDKEHSTEATTNGSSMPQGSASAMQGVNSAQSVGTINPACAGSSAATSPYVNRLSPLPAHKGIRKLTSLRNRSPTGQSPVNKTRKASQGDQLPSPKSKTWKGRVAKQFRRIQHGGGASSPSSPTAPRPEGVTIGVPLEDCPPSTNHPFVPLLVELCTSIVEAKGLDIIGIYRVPGNTAAVASLTEGVNRGFDCINMQFLMQDARWNDVNVISSLLKLFFRRLPDSLLTSYLYPLFIESDKIEEPERRIATIRKLVRDLPDHHYETLKHLIFHLKKVVSHCNVNKMEARNLAIVFGPTLVRTDDDNMVTMVTDMSHQCRIVETLISHVDWFFSEEDTDDLSSIPFDVCAEAGENDTTGANQNLLLNNIQKVEGMKVESPSKEISAKDIVSSIISAANRKMQKAKGRKGGGSGGGGGGGGGGVVGQEDFAECTSDHRDGDKQGCDKHRPIEETGQQSRGQGDVRDGPEGSNSVRHRSSSEDHTQQRVSVASSILGSVIFSGNIVKSIHEADVSSQSNPEEHSEVVSPTNHEEEPSPSPHLDHRGPPYNAGPPLDLGGTIRTYAGLSATTQERIRRFELETRAMLQRDIAAKQRNSETESLLHSAVERTSESISHHSKDSYNSGTIFIKPMAHTSDESSSPEVSRCLLSAPVHSTLSRPRLHSHPNHHQRNSSPSSRQSALCPNNSPSSLGTQSVLRDSGNILPPAGDKVNYSEEGAPIGNLRRGNSAENLARQTVVQGQRLLVSEHLSFDGHKIAPNGTLKRLKTECEQPQLSSEDGAIRLPPTPNAMRRGSLDSLQEAYGQEGRDRPSSDVSDDGSDLLASLTSTFDKKLRSLLGPGASHSSGEQHSAQGSPRELHPEEAESTTPEQSRTSAPNSSSEESNQRLSERIGATTQKDPDKWSAKKEKEVTVEGMEEKVARGGNDRRSKNSVTVETTPPAETVESKPRRTDSLSKTEKTEANTKTKDGERQWRRREAGTKRGGGDDEAKLKRKNGMPDRSIKRRHTVGGTKDFDKIEWAVTNGREGDRSNNSALPDEKERGTADGEGEVGLRAWVGRERLRTSSPDLGCRRALGSSFVVEINVLLPGAVVGRCGVVRGDGGPGGGVGARPHGLPTTRVHEQPLESHV